MTARQIKELSELLIDIHGQHEHQSLLHKKKHMEILDEYCGEAFKKEAGIVASLYEEEKKLHKRIQEEALNEEEKARFRAAVQPMYDRFAQQGELIARIRQA